MTRKNQALQAVCPTCGAQAGESCRRVRLAHLPRQAVHPARQTAGKAFALEPISDLFWRRVAKGSADQCWPWLGSTNHAGYGLFGAAGNQQRRPEGRSTVAHRFAYEDVRGSIPQGLHLDHLCHTNSDCAGGVTCEHRRCVNPAHLEAVSAAENARRALFKETCDKGGCGLRTCRPCLRAMRERKASDAA